jgi:hypothetical protein
MLSLSQLSGEITSLEIFSFPPLVQIEEFNKDLYYLRKCQMGFYIFLSTPLGLLP